MCNRRTALGRNKRLLHTGDANVHRVGMLRPSMRRCMSKHVCGAFYTTHASMCAHTTPPPPPHNHHIGRPPHRPTDRSPMRAHGKACERVCAWVHAPHSACTCTRTHKHTHTNTHVHTNSVSHTVYTSAGQHQITTPRACMDVCI